MPEPIIAELNRVQPVSESFTTANGGGVLVTAGAINTKGAVAVVSASTPFDSWGVHVALTNKSAAADLLVDIMLGVAGQEYSIIPNIYYTAGSNSSYGKNYFFPVFIPAGSRVTARSQSATASVTCRVAAWLMQAGAKGHPCVGKIVDLGTNLAASRGTPLGDPAAASWGAWTQIAATAGFDLDWILGVFGDRAIATRTAGNKMWAQVGVGAAGQEYGISPEQGWNCSSTSMSINGFHGFWTPVPSSVRVAARYGATTATALGIDCIVYGGY